MTILFKEHFKQGIVSNAIFHCRLLFIGMVILQAWPNEGISQSGRYNHKIPFLNKTILGFQVTSEKKYKLKILNFHLHKVKVIFRQISAGLSAGLLSKLLCFENSPLSFFPHKVPIKRFWFESVNSVSLIYRSLRSIVHENVFTKRLTLQMSNSLKIKGSKISMTGSVYPL